MSSDFPFNNKIPSGVLNKFLIYDFLNVVVYKLDLFKLLSSVFLALRSDLVSIS